MMYAVITGMILGVCFIVAALVLGVAQRERPQTGDHTHDPREAHDARTETDHANDRNFTGHD
jgi:preprotein translocase subunit SecG